MAAEFKDTSISSTLKMTHVVFDEVSFKRLGFKQQGGDAKLGFAKNIEKIEDGVYHVSLSAKVRKEDEYEVLITITGYCEIDENAPFKDTILNENAVAILFPYIRSELTLVTAQPETEPFVMPVVNINAMLQQAKKS